MRAISIYSHSIKSSEALSIKPVATAMPCSGFKSSTRLRQAGATDKETQRGCGLQGCRIAPDPKGWRKNGEYREAVIFLPGVRVARAAATEPPWHVHRLNSYRGTTHAKWTEQLTWPHIHEKTYPTPPYTVQCNPITTANRPPASANTHSNRVYGPHHRSLISASPHGIPASLRSSHG